MRLFKAVLTVLLIGGWLAGCGQKEPAAGPAAKKPQKLLMWLVGSESQAMAVQKLGEEYFSGREVRFNCEAISWDNAHTKYLTSISGNIVPDIGTMSLTWGTEFGSLGAMVDLAKEFPRDTKELKHKTFSGLWDALEYKEQVYGIPFDLSLQVLFYRNDIIARPPATWEQLEDILLELKHQDKGMIFDWGSLSWIGYAPYLWQAGGDFYDQTGTKSTLDSDQAAQALKFFAGLYNQFGVPRTRIPLEQGMRTGDFPLALSGNWKVDSLRLSAPEISGKWSVAMLPAGPTGKQTAFLGGRVMGIFSQSKNRQLAWEFIRFLFQPEVQLKLYQAARQTQDSYLPTNIDSWSALPMEADYKNILKSQAMDAQGPPSILGWDESTRFIEQAIQRVVLQGADAREQLTQAARQMQQQIRP